MREGVAHEGHAAQHQQRTEQASDQPEQCRGHERPLHEIVTEGFE